MMRIYDQKDLVYGHWDMEFDTVIGRVGGVCLLTIVLPRSSLFIARILKKKDQDHVCREFDVLEKIFKNNRVKDTSCGGIWWWFSSMLTDRGSEMGDFLRLETSRYLVETPEEHENVWYRCPVFYCDPYSSWQKPHIEEMHTLLRRIIPRGTWFEELNQRDINRACSHINSYSRERLGGATPFEMAPPGFGDKLTRALGMKWIDADEVNLTPRLLDH